MRIRFETPYRIEEASLCKYTNELLISKFAGISNFSKMLKEIYSAVRENMPSGCLEIKLSGMLKF